MMKGMKTWLMDVGLRLVVPRLFAALVVFVAGTLLDAGLLGGEVVDALRALLVP